MKCLFTDMYQIKKENPSQSPTHSSIYTEYELDVDRGEDHYLSNASIEGVPRSFFASYKYKWGSFKDPLIFSYLSQSLSGTFVLFQQENLFQERFDIQLESSWQDANYLTRQLSQLGGEINYCKNHYKENRSYQTKNYLPNFIRQINALKSFAEFISIDKLHPILQKRLKQTEQLEKMGLSVTIFYNAYALIFSKSFENHQNEAVIKLSIEHSSRKNIDKVSKFLRSLSQKERIKISIDCAQNLSFTIQYKCQGICQIRQIIKRIIDLKVIKHYRKLTIQFNKEQQISTKQFQFKDDQSIMNVAKFFCIHYYKNTAQPLRQSNQQWISLSSSKEVSIVNRSYSEYEPVLQKLTLQYARSDMLYLTVYWQSGLRQFLQNMYRKWTDYMHAYWSQMSKFIKLLDYKSFQIEEKFQAFYPNSKNIINNFMRKLNMRSMASEIKHRISLLKQPTKIEKDKVKQNFIKQIQNQLKISEHLIDNIIKYLIVAQNPERKSQKFKMSISSNLLKDKTVNFSNLIAALEQFQAQTSKWQDVLHVVFKDVKKVNAATKTNNNKLQSLQKIEYQKEEEILYCYFKDIQNENLVNVNCLGCTKHFIYNMNICDMAANKVKFLTFQKSDFLNDNKAILDIKLAICSLLNDVEGGVILFNVERKYRDVMVCGSVITEDMKQQFRNQINVIIKSFEPYVPQEYIIVNFVPVITNPYVVRPFHNKQLQYDGDFAVMKNKRYIRRKFYEGTYVMRIIVKPKDQSQVFFFYHDEKPYLSILNNEKIVLFNISQLHKIIKEKMRLYINEEYSFMSKHLLKLPSPLDHICQEPHSGIQTYFRYDLIDLKRKRLENSYKYLTFLHAKEDLWSIIIKQTLSDQKIKCQIQAKFKQYEFCPLNSVILYHDISINELTKILQDLRNQIIIEEVTKHVKLNNRGQKNPITIQQLQYFRKKFVLQFPTSQLRLFELHHQKTVSFYLQTEKKIEGLFVYLLLGHCRESAEFNKLQESTLSDPVQWKEITSKKNSAGRTKVDQIHQYLGQHLRQQPKIFYMSLKEAIKTVNQNRQGRFCCFNQPFFFLQFFQSFISKENFEKWEKSILYFFVDKEQTDQKTLVLSQLIKNKDCVKFIGLRLVKLWIKLQIQRINLLTNEIKCIVDNFSQNSIQKFGRIITEKLKQQCSQNDKISILCKQIQKHIIDFENQQPHLNQSKKTQEDQNIKEPRFNQNAHTVQIPMNPLITIILKSMENYFQNLVINLPQEIKRSNLLQSQIQYQLSTFGYHTTFKKYSLTQHNFEKQFNDQKIEIYLSKLAEDKYDYSRKTDHFLLPITQQINYLKKILAYFPDLIIQQQNPVDIIFYLRSLLKKKRVAFAKHDNIKDTNNLIDSLIYSSLIFTNEMYLQQVLILIQNEVSIIFGSKSLKMFEILEKQSQTKVFKIFDYLIALEIDLLNKQQCQYSVLSTIANLKKRIAQQTNRFVQIIEKFCVEIDFEDDICEKLQNYLTFLHMLQQTHSLKLEISAKNVNQLVERIQLRILFIGSNLVEQFVNTYQQFQKEIQAQQQFSLNSAFKNEKIGDNLNVKILKDDHQPEFGKPIVIKNMRKTLNKLRGLYEIRVKAAQLFPIIVKSIKKIQLMMENKISPLLKQKLTLQNSTFFGGFIIQSHTYDYYPPSILQRPCLKWQTMWQNSENLIFQPLSKYYESLQMFQAHNLQYFPPQFKILSHRSFEQYCLMRQIQASWADEQLQSIVKLIKEKTMEIPQQQCQQQKNKIKGQLMVLICLAFNILNEKDTTYLSYLFKLNTKQWHQLFLWAIRQNDERLENTTNATLRQKIKITNIKAIFTSLVENAEVHIVFVNKILTQQSRARFQSLINQLGLSKKIFHFNYQHFIQSVRPKQLQSGFEKLFNYNRKNSKFQLFQENQSNYPANLFSLSTKNRILFVENVEDICEKYRQEKMSYHTISSIPQILQNIIQFINKLIKILSHKIIIGSFCRKRPLIQLRQIHNSFISDFGTIINIDSNGKISQRLRYSYKDAINSFRPCNQGEVTVFSVELPIRFGTKLNEYYPLYLQDYYRKIYVSSSFQLKDLPLTIRKILVFWKMLQKEEIQNACNDNQRLQWIRSKIVKSSQKGYLEFISKKIMEQQSDSNLLLIVLKNQDQFYNLKFLISKNKLTSKCYFFNTQTQSQSLIENLQNLYYPERYVIVTTYKYHKKIAKDLIYYTQLLQNKRTDIILTTFPETYFLYLHREQLGKIEICLPTPENQAENYRQIFKQIRCNQSVEQAINLHKMINQQQQPTIEITPKEFSKNINKLNNESENNLRLKKVLLCINGCQQSLVSIDLQKMVQNIYSFGKNQFNLLLKIIVYRNPLQNQCLSIAQTPFQTGPQKFTEFLENFSPSGTYSKTNFIQIQERIKNTLEVDHIFVIQDKVSSSIDSQKIVQITFPKKISSINNVTHEKLVQFYHRNQARIIEKIQEEFKESSSLNSSDQSIENL